MNVGDKIVCIKPYFLEDYEVPGFSFKGVDIKIGDIYTITSIVDYISEGIIKYDDVQSYAVCNGEFKWSFFSKELSYRYCIYDYFTLLAPLRDKRIDEILND